MVYHWAFNGETYVGTAIPAVKDHLETLGSLDTNDIDIPNPIPKSSSSLRIIPIESDTGQNTSALIIQSAKVQGITIVLDIPLTSSKPHNT